jgi:hypothetical protein
LGNGRKDFERLVATLKKTSPEFGQWWQRHEVLRPLTGHKRIRHPEQGLMAFEHTSLTVSEQSDMRLVVYTPVDIDGTVEKLEALLGRPRPAELTA